MKFSKVYIDLDGVLFDWATAFAPYLDPKNPDKAFKAFVADDGFVKLLPLAGSKELVKGLLDLRDSGVELEILSSAGGRPTVYEEVKWQKFAAVRKHFPELWEVCAATIVEKSSVKATYATPDSILIDDYEKNVNAFRDAGGHAFLYTGNYQEALETIWDGVK